MNTETPQKPSRYMVKRALEDRIMQLEEENRRLEKELKIQKLNVKAYSTMTDLAEKYFNIPIRKKFGILL